MSAAQTTPITPQEKETVEDMPKSLEERMFRLRSQKRKKEHEQLIKRGEDATKLIEKLEKSFQKNRSLSAVEMKELESLENIVVRIRKGLGGNDDRTDDTDIIGSPLPTIEKIISTLKETTFLLFDELKKTSRFSISAVAIQTSNSAIKLIRFLRVRR